MAAGGALVSLLCLSLSRRIGERIRIGWKVSRPIYIVLVIVGVVTGLLIGEGGLHCVLSLVGVTVLLVIQTPIDLAFRRLAREPTLIVSVSFVILQVTKAVAEKSWGELLVPLSVAFCTTGIVATLHRLAKASVGFGDVLLTFPLALSLASVSFQVMPWWMLIASLTGSIHALLVRRRSKLIPFGPHLLFGAWLMLLISV